MTRPDTGTHPLWRQVADALRRAIERGEFTPGAAIPSEADLQAQYGVSRDTVRKALSALTQEGLLTSGQGRARYVRSYAPLRWSLSSFESRSHHEMASDGMLDAWSTEVKRSGRKPAETIEVSIIIPPERIAQQLDVQGGKFVVLRSRVRYVDDAPYQIADSYFPEDLVRNTPLMEPHSVSAPGGILASIGRPQAKYIDEIVVRMPTPDEVRRLELPAGTPIAEITRTGYDQDRVPLRVMVTISPGDRHVLVYEMDAA